MEGCLTAIHLQVIISWQEWQTQPSNANDDRSHSKIADYVPFCFLFISHKQLLQYAQILVDIYIQGSSNYSPKFNSNGHRLTIQTIHLPKLLCSKMAANRADKISLKSDVLLNQYSNKLKVPTCPKWGMRSPKFEAIPTTFESQIAGLKITF